MIFALSNTVKSLLFRRSYRVRTWLILLVIACIVPPLLFSAALLIQNTRDERVATEAQVTDRARLLGDDIDRELARILAVGEVLALSESLEHRNLHRSVRARRIGMPFGSPVRSRCTPTRCTSRARYG